VSLGVAVLWVTFEAIRRAPGDLLGKDFQAGVWLVLVGSLVLLGAGVAVGRVARVTRRDQVQSSGGVV
jgi:hypothetical protein